MKISFAKLEVLSRAFPGHSLESSEDGFVCGHVLLSELGCLKACAFGLTALTPDYFVAAG